MKVEVLFFDECPNYQALLPHLRELMNAAGAEDAAIELVRVEDPYAAEAERFLGSPTVRIDGQDVEPGADERSDFGLKCRLFATPDGLRGTPADEWVVGALERLGPPAADWSSRKPLSRSIRSRAPRTPPRAAGPVGSR